MQDIEIQEKSREMAGGGPGGLATVTAHSIEAKYRDEKYISRL